MSEYGAANDLLPPTRSLTPHDVTEIIRPDVLFWAEVLDDAAKIETWRKDPDLAFGVILLATPRICREIAWRGTWLKPQDIYALDDLTAGLITVEVMKECHRTGNFRRCVDAATAMLLPYSRLLQARAA